MLLPGDPFWIQWKSCIPSRDTQNIWHYVIIMQTKVEREIGFLGALYFIYENSWEISFYKVINFSINAHVVHNP